MIQVCTAASNSSCRKAIAHLTGQGIPFVERKLKLNPLSVGEIKELLKYTKEGIYDIVSTRSKAFQRISAELADNGTEFDDLKVDDVIALIAAEPGMLKTPIIFGNGMLNIGYNEEFSQLYVPRHARTSEMARMLGKLRPHEDKLIAEGKKLPTGHWAEKMERGVSV